MLENIGDRGPNVEEPLGWVQTYPIQLYVPRIDLAELAKLRWIKGWSRADLAKRYGKTPRAIQNYFYHLRLKDFRGVRLSANDLRMIKRRIGG